MEHTLQTPHHHHQPHQIGFHMNSQEDKRDNDKTKDDVI